jgi:hypothetical protein
VKMAGVGSGREWAQEDNMDTANFLIIIVTILVLGGSARYIRGHWF